MNEAGFNGWANVGKVKVGFRRGYDLLSLKEYLYLQPYNAFFWCEREKLFLYRNKAGELFKLNFEKLDQ